MPVRTFTTEHQAQKAKELIEEAVQKFRHTNVTLHEAVGHANAEARRDINSTTRLGQIVHQNLQPFFMKTNKGWEVRVKDKTNQTASLPADER